LGEVFFEFSLSGLENFFYYLCYAHNCANLMQGSGKSNAMEFASIAEAQPSLAGNLPAKLRNSLVKGEYFSFFYHLRCNLNPNWIDGANGCSL
jgi:hypothetical protein